MFSYLHRFCLGDLFVAKISVCVPFITRHVWCAIGHVH
jgi:hypothetical protein